MSNTSASSKALSKFKSETFKTVKENVVGFGLMLLLVLGVRSTVIEAFKIPSGSMIPTLLVGDHIFVNKFAYGIKLPFSDWILDEPVYLIKREGPKRGDIVVFKFPKDQRIYYIKRVIGIPGDKIELKDKILYVNDVAMERTPVTAEERTQLLKDVDSPTYSQDSIAVSHEKFGDKTFTMMTDQNSFMTSRFGPIEVPQGQYFMMGDNRDYSNDSRFWGFVPFGLVRGKAMFIWLSVWIDFEKGEYFFRPSRIGTGLK